MADKRAFAKFDVGYLDNPKMMDVLDASGNAVLMHVASVLYSAQHLTDGVVAPRTMQRKAAATDDDTRVLIEAGLWHEPGHDCPSCPQPPAGKVYVHDFLEHNRSSDEAKDKSSAGKKAAEVRWGKRADSNADRMQDALPVGMPDAMQRERERERDKNTSPSAPVAAIAAEFAQWYADYPKKVAKPEALKAFTKARKTTDLQTLVDGLARYKEAIKAANTERRFIANPASWLNAGRWEDDYQPQKPTGTYNPLWDN